MRQSSTPRRRGAILAAALVTLLVVTILSGVVLRSYLQAYRQLRLEQDQAQVEWLAESALARALVRHKMDATYARETWKAEMPRATGEPATGVSIIAIERSADPTSAIRITVEARFPDDDVRRVQARRTLSIPPTDN